MQTAAQVTGERLARRLSTKCLMVTLENTVGQVLSLVPWILWGEWSNVLTIVIGGTFVEPDQLCLDPKSELKVDRRNFCIELFRPDRLERMLSFHEDADVWDLDGYEGDGEAEARALDMLESDDPLLMEDYILS
ncbi:hypothetical protein MRX96_036639 [Rhipicephalus microplus]